MIEILVVLGIMILLAGILLPVVLKAYGRAVSVRMQADLAAIQAALDAYKADHNGYPRVQVSVDGTGTPIPSAADRPNPPTGAQILCWALIGPAPAREAGTGTNRRKQDGMNGPGFRTRYTAGEDGAFNTGDDSMGKSYGPYLNPETFRYGVPGDPITTVETDVLLFCLLDRNDQPILYFPAAAGKPNIRATITTTTPAETGRAYIDGSEASLYDADDNLAAIALLPADALRKMRILFGERTATLNGFIDPGETPVEGPYILWCAGADDTFGPRGDEMPPRNTTPDEQDVPKCDDVTLPAFR